MKKIFLHLFSILCFTAIQGQWNVVTTPYPNDAVYGLKFMNSTIYAVTSRGIFLRSTNKGASWFEKQIFNAQYLTFAGDFDNLGNGFAVTSNGRIGKTTDFGDNWTSQIVDLAANYRFVHFAADGSGVVFAGGLNNNNQSGIAYKSTDNGTNWFICTSPGYNVNTGYALDQFTFFIGGGSTNPADGKISKSIDAGSNWSTQTLTNSGEISSIFFFDSQSGWLGTKTGKLYITLNGGINWTLLNTLTNQINKVYFKDFQTGWIGASNGRIYFTSNSGGDFTLQPTGVTENIYALALNNADNAMAAGGLIGSILISTNGGGALPISLSSFNGKALNNTVQLFWKTASEQNNKGFDIERLSGNEWKSIGYVNGKGNSTTPADYSFTDERPLAGDNKYRLKQTDLDGKFSYSKVLSLTAGEPENTFSVSPNPSTGDRIMISYAVKQTTEVCIEIISSSGQRIKTVVNKKLNSGNYIENISVKSLPNAAYYIQARFGKNKAVTKKIVR